MINCRADFEVQFTYVQIPFENTFKVRVRVRVGKVRVSRVRVRVRFYQPNSTRKGWIKL